MSNDRPSSSMGVIHPLPPQTISTLRSSSLITSVAQAVTELVQNALDAHARQVVVYLDLERWALRVEDDGTGMRRETVEAIGSGLRYGTSKTTRHSSLALQSTFGFRGEALASLSSIGSLEIASCTKDSSVSWSSSIKGSNPISSGPSTTYKRIKPGTTVILKDLFFNLPVRRTAHPSPQATLSGCRKALETASMLFPEVAFSLVDRAKENDPAGGRIWGVSKTSTIVSRFSALHGTTLVQSITPLELWEIPDNIDHLGEMRLDGFISLQGAHTRSYQYLYVNRHPLAWCDVHRAIETRFDRSGFSRAARGDTPPGSPSGSRRSPRRLDRKPVYVINLSVPPRKLDLNLDPTKSAVHFEDWAAVISLVVSAVDAFLGQHGLSVVPSATNRILHDQSNQGSPSPSPTKRPRTPKGRVDAIRAGDGASFMIEPALGVEGTLVRWQDPLTREVFFIDSRTGHCFPSDFKRSSGAIEDEDEDLDLVARKRRRSLKPRDDVNGVDPQKAPPNWLQRTLEDWSDPIFTSRSEPTIPAISPHLPPSRYPDTSGGSSGDNHLCPPAPTQGNPFQHPTSSTFKSAVNYFASPFQHPNSNTDLLQSLDVSQFSKTSLRSAQVIAQVDRKFIACVLPEVLPSSSPSKLSRDLTSGAGSLVLIDQHAADERLRVERFLEEIGTGFLSTGTEGGGIPQTRTPSMLLLLTPNEHLQIVHDRSLLDAFARWGIQLRLPDVSPESTSSAPVQICVDAVPTLLVDRLEGKKTKGEVEGGVGREAPRELAELVKSYLARLVATDHGRELEAVLRARPTGNGADEWLGALRFCPREMLDLINSKACRGAVMFNDPLSSVQCRKLIRDLARTIFPFQCAHGRPSIVPLVDLSDFSAASKTRSTRRRRRALDWEGLGLDS